MTTLVNRLGPHECFFNTQLTNLVLLTCNKDIWPRNYLWWRHFGSYKLLKGNEFGL